jgi:predicted Zn-dependent protease
MPYLLEDIDKMRNEKKIIKAAEAFYDAYEAVIAFAIRNDDEIETVRRHFYASSKAVLDAVAERRRADGERESQ